MPPRIAMKISEETLAMIATVTGASPDVFGDQTYMVATILSFEPLEFTVKFVNEDTAFAEVKNDSNMHILSV